MSHFWYLFSAYLLNFIGLVGGILSFRYQNKYFKFLFYQFIVNCFFFVVGYAYLEYLKSIGEPAINMWIMNIQLIIEMELIFYALFWVIKSKRQRNLIKGVNLVFLLVYITQLSTDGIFGYLNWADLTACLGFTILFYLVFYELSKANQKSWWKSPEILATLGLFIYFACSVPFISMHNYLTENHPEIAKFIYYKIAMGLFFVRYILFAWALFLVYKNSGKQLIRP